MDIYKMDTRVGLSLPEGPSIDNFVSRLMLFNNSLYNLYFFV